MEFIRLNTHPGEELETAGGATLAQSRAWMDFVAEAQHAEPVVAEIRGRNERLGWFTGLIVSKYGLRILGSPFPGWTTSYMGFVLHEGVSRTDAFKTLIGYSRRELRCHHLELMDRRLSTADIVTAGCEYRLFRGFEIDLAAGKDAVWQGLASSTQRNIRKAEREGVRIEIAEDDAFADDYHAQLVEVFTRQDLKPTYSVERVRLLLKHLRPTGRLLCLRALHPNGQCIASGIFPADHDRMYFWGGASRTEYRILRPNQAIQWAAMQYWQERGVRTYDLGGGGDYKRKYGGCEIEVPWLRHSHLPLLGTLRNLAQRVVAFRQRR